MTRLVFLVDILSHVKIESYMSLRFHVKKHSAHLVTRHCNSSSRDYDSCLEHVHALGALKMQEYEKMTDQIARHEIAGHEIATYLM